MNTIIAGSSTAPKATAVVTTDKKDGGAMNETAGESVVIHELMVT